jgi:hypothetical protein
MDHFQGRHQGVFLFSSDVAVPFYQECGFSPASEVIEVMEVTPVAPQKGLVKLNPERPKELARIHSYAVCRVPVSQVFFVGNAKLSMFHILYGLGNYVFEVPDLNCLVLFKRERGCLKIFDIVGGRSPSFRSCIPISPRKDIAR